MLTDKRLNYVNECIKGLPTTLQRWRAYYHTESFSPEKKAVPEAVKNLSGCVQYLFPDNSFTTENPVGFNSTMESLATLTNDFTTSIVMPYPNIAIVYSIVTPNRSPDPFIIQVQDKGDHLAITSFTNVRNYWMGAEVTSIIPKSCSKGQHIFEGRVNYPTAFKVGAIMDTKGLQLMSVRGALAVLVMLQSKTYEDTIVQSRLSRVAAERRAKRKQPPVIETRVLTLKVPQVVTRSHGAAQGGTHASPREHTRSGHWRHYASGKEVWIKDCIVGSAEKGKITKIYNVVTE